MQTERAAPVTALDANAQMLPGPASPSTSSCYQIGPCLPSSYYIHYLITAPGGTQMQQLGLWGSWVNNRDALEVNSSPF
jgi:hypothetical protein